MNVYLINECVCKNTGYNLGLFVFSPFSHICLAKYCGEFGPERAMELQKNSKGGAELEVRRLVKDFPRTDLYVVSA